MQESGLVAIIPLMNTCSTWGQNPLFSHPEFPQRIPLGVAAAVDCWMVGVGGGGASWFHPDFPQGAQVGVAAM